MRRRYYLFLVTAVIQSLNLWASSAQGQPFPEEPSVILGGNEIRFADSFAFSPDGKVIAASEVWWGNVIQFWDVEKQKQIRTFEAHGDYVFDLAFSPDGGTLVSSGGKGDARTIRFWSIDPQYQAKLPF